MDKIIKKYTNGEITVVWQPHLCDHSAVCINELPKVFDPFSRPWIKMDAASTDRIKEVVAMCPTRALTWFQNGVEKEINESENLSDIKKTSVLIIKDGPIRILGNFILYNEDNEPVATEEKISLCRCGKSSRMPFCDGSHKMINK